MSDRNDKTMKFADINKELIAGDDGCLLDLYGEKNGQRERHSGSLLLKDDSYEPPKTTPHSLKSMDTLSDKFSSIELVERIQRGTVRFEEFERLDGSGKVLDGPMAQGFRLSLDVDKFYKKDEDGDTLLHTAILILAQDLAFYFIDRTPWFTWLNIQNKMLQTPLHLAVLTNQVSVVRRLIVAGADMESRDRDGNTAIHLACRDNLLNVLRALVDPITSEELKSINYKVPIQKKSQIINSKNYEGHTGLHIASSLGYMDIMDILIDNEADINARAEKSGRTILHEAAWNGNLMIVKYLTSLGKRCEVNSKTYDGYTAFDLARSRGHWSIVLELATAGAKEEDQEMEQ